MLTFLAVVGLGLTLAAMGIKMGAQQDQNAEDIRIAELKAEQLRESQAISDAEQALIKSQQAEVDKDILAAGGIYNINQKALTIQGLQTAYAGASAKGQVGARAGAGNLQGASILRQAASIQKKTEQQMSLIAGEKTKLGIEYSDTLREFDIKKQTLGVSLLTSELKEEWALEDAAEWQAQADYLKEYGWLNILGVGMSGLSNVINVASGLGV
jgi:hypothetical protein